MKKGAALLITLLIITAVATFAFTAARSIISSLSRTTKSTDSIAAREAANGGIEWGLLKYKEMLANNYDEVYPCILDFAGNNCVTTLPNGTYAEVKIFKYYKIVGGVKVFTGDIYSVGRAGSTYNTMHAAISGTGKVTLGEQTTACFPHVSGLPLPNFSAVVTGDVAQSGNNQRTIVRDSKGGLYSVSARNAFPSVPGDGSNTEIYLDRSADNGRTWVSKRITTTISSYENMQMTPAMAIDSNDKIHIVWSGEPGTANYNYLIRYCQYDTVTGQCSAVQNVKPDNDSGSAYAPAIAIDSNNKINLTWRDTGLKAPVYCQYSGVGACTNPVKLDDLSLTEISSQSIAIDANNNIHVVWAKKASDGTRSVYYRKNIVGSGWQPIQKVTNDNQVFSATSVAIDSDNNPHIVWTNQISDNRVQVKYCKFTGKPCGALVIDECPSQTSPTISLSKAGEIYITFQTRFGAENDLARFCHFNGTSCDPSYLALGWSPRLLWANFPIIGGLRTNIPTAGWSGMWDKSNGNAPETAQAHWTELYATGDNFSW